MDFLIADTFTDSLGRLAGDEQRAVKTTAFDLQTNPSAPGLQFHRLDRAKDKRFWSVRVSEDLRVIVHRTDGSLLLCYTGHHKEAYRWAERRRLETHPTTGAAQLVEIRETVQEVVVPVFVEVEQPALPKPLLFAQYPDDELLGYGVPAEWLPEVRTATDDTVLDIVSHLPGEASDALLELATGKRPEPPVKAEPGDDPFAHPDAQRRFRAMNNPEELERALDYPWDKWTVFLHPAQRAMVERDYNGPARVSGSAGTGKTIVALHRAVHLARANPDAVVLLTTLTDILANALRVRFRRLASGEPRLSERVEIATIDEVAGRLYKAQWGKPRFVSPGRLRELIQSASDHVGGHRFSIGFLVSEWEEVVDAWQLASWESYRDVRRLGRKTRLTEKQREVLWSIFERVRTALDAEGLMTPAALLTRLAGDYSAGAARPYDHVVVDESQDVSIPQLRFLASLCADRPNGLFFAGDLGQRIFQRPFSWRALGIDIRGRGRTLRVNYRTSHQIRMQADRLLSPEVSDMDGNVEERRGTVSVFNGPRPGIEVLTSIGSEVDVVGRWLSERLKTGVLPHEIGVFVRSELELGRAQSAVAATGVSFRILDESTETVSGCIAVGTMHLAKGLEFRAVAVMACDDEVIPLQERIEGVTDESDLEEVYNTERQLLYVACTRARDYLSVSGVAPASEFLEDLRTEGPGTPSDTLGIYEE